MRGMRVLLVIAGSLAIVAPSLAEDNPPPGSDGCIGCGATNSQPRPQADWQELSRGGGEASRYKKGPNGGRIVTDRISYARTAKQTRGWLRALAEPDRAALKTINFRRYGVLAVWLTRRFGFTINGVFLVGAHGLTVDVSQLPFQLPPGCSPCVMPIGIVPLPSYVLITVRKASLPGPVQALYITDVADP